MKRGPGRPREDGKRRNIWIDDATLRKAGRIGKKGKRHNASKGIRIAVAAYDESRKPE